LRSFYHGFYHDLGQNPGLMWYLHEKS